MTPASLPLELFARIFEELPPQDTWRQRRVSRAWKQALSTSTTVNAALRGQDFQCFKQHHLAKPVSYTTLPFQPGIMEKRLALDGQCLAYLRKSDHAYELHIHDLEGEEIRIKLELEFPTPLVMGNVIAFADKHTLYMFTKTGQRRTRSLPGEFKIGPVLIGPEYSGTLGCKGNIVALSQPEGDQDLLWIYDYALDTWETHCLPGLRKSLFKQAILIVDEVYVITVGFVKMTSPEHGHYVLLARSREREWNARYTLTGRPQYSPGISECAVHWTGQDYQLVVKHYACHNVFFTFDGIVAIHDGISARWNGKMYRALDIGIETKSGFLWHESQPRSGCWLRRLLINEAYLVLRIDTNRGTKIFVLRFGGTGECGYEFVWEDKHDRQKQIQQRRAYVSNSK